MEGEKDRTERLKITLWVILANGPAGARVKKDNFLAKIKSLNEFIMVFQR
jgi:hypothetical protein